MGNLFVTITSHVHPHSSSFLAFVSCYCHRASDYAFTYIHSTKCWTGFVEITVGKAT
jgi:hypothetical protein